MVMAMADVFWLAADERPPEGVDYVLVRAVPSGGYIIHGHAARWRGAPIFYAPPPEPDQDTAIDHAEVWADKHGVPAVYVARP